MSYTENIHRLRLFGIPGDAPSDESDRVRRVLARLVEAESLSLSDLQTARDIARRAPCAAAESYLFLAAMFLSVRGGNTFLRPEKGPALLERGGHLDGKDEIGEYGRDAFAADVDEVWPAAVAAAGALDGEIVLRRRDDRGDRWFFQRDANAVDAVSAAFAALASQPPCAAPLSAAELAAAAAFREFELDDPQKEAVKSAVTRRFTVVTGGPGTGKTTIVFSILRALVGRGLSTEEIALAAPTGRAAQRIGESLRKQCAAAEGLDESMRLRIESLKGSTIHSLLGGYPPNWKYTADNPLPLKLVVVDESSMVDVMLMRALVEALPDGCRLVLLGDRDQLPSVEAGAVLGDVVDGGGGATSCVVRLVASKRYPEELARCAEAVKNGDVPGLFASAGNLSTASGSWTDRLESSGAGCFLLPLGDEAAKRRDACHEAVGRWAAHFGLLERAGALVRLASADWADDPALVDGSLSDRAKALFEEFSRSRILSVVRRGPYGVEKINEILVTKRFGRKPANALSKPGVPVIVTRNTPTRSLWNGDIGVTVKGPAGMVVLFERGDRVVSCPVALLPEHDLAYAITVHKSQGSEYGNVLVVLPDDKDHPLLSCQLVYTGITRAKQRAVILGTEDALKAAIRNEIKRDTGIVLA